MAYQGFNTTSNIPFVTQMKPSETQSHPDLSLGADGFDIWWNKTSAQHAAVLAQASALMCAHKRVSSIEKNGIGQAF
jgi:hypothetical protein